MIWIRAFDHFIEVQIEVFFEVAGVGEPGEKKKDEGEDEDEDDFVVEPVGDVEVGVGVEEKGTEGEEHEDDVGGDCLVVRVCLL